MTKGIPATTTRHRARLLCVALCLLLLAGVREAAAQARGGQLTPDGKRTLVNKDVGNERWAISLNDDDSVTGNVFRTDGDPAFLYCFPIAGGALSCWGADACTEGGGGPQRGIQQASNGIILVNKDVGDERWAINLNPDGTATGNVFRADGGPPAFIFCTPGAGANAFSCSGADTCTTETCIDQYTFIADVTLPADFFTVPAPCPETFEFVAEVTLPPTFFTPPEVVSFTATASTTLQSFRLHVTYPTAKGGISGSGSIAGCSSTAPNFLQNDQDDGNLILLTANTTDLTFPIDIKCAYDEIPGQDLNSANIGVEVLSVTHDNASGNPASLSVAKDVTP